MKKCPDNISIDPMWVCCFYWLTLSHSSSAHCCSFILHLCLNEWSQSPVFMNLRLRPARTVPPDHTLSNTEAFLLKKNSEWRYLFHNNYMNITLSESTQTRKSMEDVIENMTQLRWPRRLLAAHICWHHRCVNMWFGGTTPPLPDKLPNIDLACATGSKYRSKLLLLLPPIHNASRAMWSQPILSCAPHAHFFLCSWFKKHRAEKNRTNELRCAFANGAQSELLWPLRWAWHEHEHNKLRHLPIIAMPSE